MNKGFKTFYYINCIVSANKSLYSAYKLYYLRLKD